MTKHKIGDIVYLESGSGYGVPAGVYSIPDLIENREEHWECPICNTPTLRASGKSNKSCKEWPTLLSEDGSCHVHHVSDCEMEEL